MKIRIERSSAAGRLAAPPSKSMAHRLLIGGGLADGESVITNVALSEDICATLDCLAALGARWGYDGGTVRIEGTGGKARTPAPPLHCRECGSTLRFFIPLALLSDCDTELGGAPRLLARPLGPYGEIAREKGLLFENTGRKIRVRGPLSSGDFRIPGNISSQFVSGLLFDLPLLKEESRIFLTGGVESRSYIDLTLRALASFGVKAFWEEETTLRVPGNQSYRPARLSVEGDYSNAAFFDALNLLGDRVKIDGLLPDSGQGDRVYAAYFERIAAGSPTLSVADCPDLAPILMALAAAFHGLTLTGTERLKIKESDRGEAMAEELKKCGVRTILGDNSIRVLPGGLHAPEEELNGHNDHRIVMALSVLLTRLGGVIAGAEAVAKSLPDFFPRLRALGISADEIIEPESGGFPNGGFPNGGFPNSGSASSPADAKSSAAAPAACPDPSAPRCSELPEKERS